jgi:signal transduction histidine kinase
LESGSLEQPIEIQTSGELSDLVAPLNKLSVSFKNLRDRATRAERLAALGESATHVAHGLRNPLHSIRTVAEFEREAPHCNPDAKVAFQHIIATVNILDRWSRDLIMTVRPLEPKLGSHPIEPLVQDTLALLKPRLADSAIQVDFECGDSVPPVLLDRTLFEQALVAVLANAIDATPENGRITIRAINGDNGTVLISIEDQGDGMSEVVKNKAFLPFFSTKPNSTGLGLTIAQKIVTLLQGRIELDRQQTKGTRVIIHLPVAK